MNSLLESRRTFLQKAACGFGYTALATLLHQQARSNVPLSGSPLAPKQAHHHAKAKRVIFLFMHGGPSQMESFDYKPRLNAEHGNPAPFRREENEEQPGIGRIELFGSPWKFARHGASGTYVSELFPELAKQIDDVCVLNGMHTDNLAHAPACLQLHTGTTNFVWPSMGAWAVYGLGTANQNLPGYVTVSHLVGGDGGSPHQFGSAFLPNICQGTRIVMPGEAGAGASLRHLRDENISTRLQRRQLDFLKKLNTAHLQKFEKDPQMEGMIESFELAFRMQMEAPDLLTFEGESEATRKLYGIGESATDWFGRQCLLARRLAENGVRFIQLNSSGWDHHGHIRQSLPGKAVSVDRPIAGLLRDLKARGMLEETLIVWSGEFGRTPYWQNLSDEQNKDNYGRGHNPYGFTTLMAGGGVRGGMTYGATDEFGYRAVEGKVHVHDLHATILHLLGLDHERLTYRHQGRDFRLTDVYGRVIKQILT